MQSVTFGDIKKALTNEKDLKLILDTEVLFWRLLVVSIIRDIDMRKILHNKLVAVLPALIHAPQ